MLGFPYILNFTSLNLVIDSHKVIFLFTLKSHCISLKDKSICNASYRAPMIRIYILSILDFKPYVMLGLNT